MSASRIALPVAAIAAAVVLLGFGATQAKAQYCYYPGYYVGYYAYPTYYYYVPPPVVYYTPPLVVAPYPSWCRSYAFHGGFYHGGCGRSWGFNFGFGYAR